MLNHSLIISFLIFPSFFFLDINWHFSQLHVLNMFPLSLKSTSITGNHTPWQIRWEGHHISYLWSRMGTWYLSFPRHWYNWKQNYLSDEISAKIFHHWDSNCGPGETFLLLFDHGNLPPTWFTLFQTWFLSKFIV